MTDDWPSLDDLRLRYIARVLEREGGNKTRAADVLGIDRRTLNRILARQRARAAMLARLQRPPEATAVRGGSTRRPPRAGATALAAGAASRG